MQSWLGADFVFHFVVARLRNHTVFITIFKNIINNQKKTCENQLMLDKLQHQESVESSEGRENFY